MTGEKVSFRARAIEKIVYGLGLVSLIVGIMWIFKPLFDQAISWLKTGTIPERDLFWATADVRCAATGGQARGWDGMELCRPDSIHFTDWVGVNQVLNYAFDIHIAVVTFVGLAVFWWVVMAVLDTFSE